MTDWGMEFKLETARNNFYLFNDGMTGLRHALLKWIDYKEVVIGTSKMGEALGYRP
jgi:hypothetical protein